MSVRLVVADVERSFDSLEWTLSDPGGCETLTAGINAGPPPNPGDRVRVYVDSVEAVWDGIVEEPGQRHSRGRQAANVTAVGQGAALKRDPYSMIYLDRDLSRWGEPPNARRLALGAYGLQPFTVQPDASGAPALLTSVKGAWNALSRPLCEPWYDSGSIGGVAGVRATWTRMNSNTNAGDANWNWNGFLAESEGGSAIASSGSLRATGPGTMDISGSGARYAVVQILYGPTTAGTANMEYGVYWTDLRVFGDHDVPLRGSGAEEGVRPTEVVEHALKQASTKFVAEIAMDALVIPHLVYRDLTTPETVITDMAKLLAWHWGVWPGSVMDDTPRFVFAPPPTEATAVVRYEDLEDLDQTEKLSVMYDEATITYEDAAAGTGRVTVSKPHPRLPEDLSQTLLLDAGQSSADAAEVTAKYALVSSQQQSRAAGSAKLPAVILDAAGRPRPAHTLQPGRDRLVIAGLPPIGGIFPESGRTDAFRVRRLTTSVTRGEPITTVEFDTGADLIETLQARQAAFTSHLGG